MRLQQNLHGLYIITDAKLCANAIVNKVEQAILGGAQVIQYRNKTATKEIQRTEALVLQSLCKKYQRCFLINDNIELAMEVNADGVHLGQTDSSLTDARKQLGDNKIIGITCHSDITSATAAEKNSADYVAFGRFYPSQTKPTAPPATLEVLQQAQSELNIPIVAIGGINNDNASALIQAGANMIAVIHAIFSAQDIKQTAQLLSDKFTTTV